jgi:hypothetical protein
MDVLAQLTNALDADGEIVWSRSPDAEIKRVDDVHGRRWQQGRSPRRSRISRASIAQGMPCDAARLWLSSCAFLPRYFCTRGRGCGCTPGIPCALCLAEGQCSCITRAQCVARTRAHACSRLASRPGLSASPWPRRRPIRTRHRPICYQRIHHNRARWCS